MVALRALVVVLAFVGFSFATPVSSGNPSSDDAAVLMERPVDATDEVSISDNQDDVLYGHEFLEEYDASDRTGYGDNYGGSKLKIVSKASARTVVKATTEVVHPRETRYEAQVVKYGKYPGTHGHTALPYGKKYPTANHEPILSGSHSAYSGYEEEGHRADIQPSYEPAAYGVGRRYQRMYTAQSQLKPVYSSTQTVSPRGAHTTGAPSAYEGGKQPVPAPSSHSSYGKPLYVSVSAPSYAPVPQYSPEYPASQGKSSYTSYGQSSQPSYTASQQPHVSTPQHPYGYSPQQPYGSAPQQSYGSASQQSYGSASQQSYGSVPQQPYGSVPQQPYGFSSPQKSHGYALRQPSESTPQKPYEAAPQKPYEAPPQQSYSTAYHGPAPQQPSESTAQHAYEAAPQKPYEAAPQKPYEAAPQKPYEAAAHKPYEAAPQQSYGSPSQLSYGSAPQQSYGSAPQQSYGSAPQQSYTSAPQQSYTSVPQQPNGSASQPSYGSASQQSYGSASQQSYGSAPQQTYGSAPQQTYGSNTQQVPGPSYASGSQPSYGSASQPPYNSTPQPSYGSAPQPSYNNAPHSAPSSPLRPYSGYAPQQSYRPSPPQHHGSVPQRLYGSNIKGQYDSGSKRPHDHAAQASQGPILNPTVSYNKNNYQQQPQTTYSRQQSSIQPTRPYQQPPKEQYSAASLDYATSSVNPGQVYQTDATIAEGSRPYGEPAKVIYNEPQSGAGSTKGSTKYSDESGRDTPVENQDILDSEQQKTTVEGIAAKPEDSEKSLDKDPVTTTTVASTTPYDVTTAPSAEAGSESDGTAKENEKRHHKMNVYIGRGKPDQPKTPADPGKNEKSE